MLGQVFLTAPPLYLPRWRPSFKLETRKMAATSIMSTDDEMNAMAGENIDVTGWTDANKTAWGLQAENYINILCRYNFSDNFGTLNVDVRNLLSEYVSRYVGISGIAYNMSGFTSRIEAEDMMNIHLYRMNKIEQILVDQKGVTYMQGA